MKRMGILMSLLVIIFFTMLGVYAENYIRKDETPLLVTNLSGTLNETQTTGIVQSEIKVTLNGKQIEFADQSPTITDGRTLVPLRAIFEALGASVEWDSVTRSVYSTKGNTSIELRIDSPYMYVNGEEKELDVSAQIIGGRTMVPARAVAEAYGVDVKWDNASKTVVLTTNSERMLPDDDFMMYSKAYASKDVSLQVAVDPEDENNSVFYLESNNGTEMSWTYFNVPAKFEPGKRYIVDYDVYVVSDALGSDITSQPVTIGVTFKYGESECVYHHNNRDGSLRLDHGSTIDGRIGSTSVASKEWTHGTYIFEMPKALNTETPMEFGIYATPVKSELSAGDISVNYYLDNVMVKEYNGDAQNGIQKANVGNIDDFSGIIFDFNENHGGLVPSFSNELINGCLVAKATDNKDPRIVSANGFSFEASKYKSVAIKISFEDYVPEEFFEYGALFGVYFITDSDSTYDQVKFVGTEYASMDSDGWNTVVVDMTMNPKWTGTITGIRFDPINGAADFSIDKIVIVEKE